MCIKLALLFFATKCPPFYGLCLYFLLSEKILILFYQFVNHYTSIYIFRHSAILPDNFLVEQSVI